MRHLEGLLGAVVMALAVGCGSAVPAATETPTAARPELAAFGTQAAFDAYAAEVRRRREARGPLPFAEFGGAPAGALASADAGVVVLDATRAVMLRGCRLFSVALEPATGPVVNAWMDVPAAVDTWCVGLRPSRDGVIVLAQLAASSDQANAAVWRFTVEADGTIHRAESVELRFTGSVIPLGAQDGFSSSSPLFAGPTLGGAAQVQTLPWPAMRRSPQDGWTPLVSPSEVLRPSGSFEDPWLHLVTRCEVAADDRLDCATAAALAPMGQVSVATHAMYLALDEHPTLLYRIDGSRVGVVRVRAITNADAFDVDDSGGIARLVLIDLDPGGRPVAPVVVAAPFGAFRTPIADLPAESYVRLPAFDPDRVSGLVAQLSGDAVAYRVQNDRRDGPAYAHHHGATRSLSAADSITDVADLEDWLAVVFSNRRSTRVVFLPHPQGAEHVEEIARAVDTVGAHRWARTSEAGVWAFRVAGMVAFFRLDEGAVRFLGTIAGAAAIECDAPAACATSVFEMGGRTLLLFRHELVEVRYEESQVSAASRVPLPTEGA